MQQYQNPLIHRYATPAMSRIFSPEFKYLTWRKLWLSLAKSQKELGLEQITEDMLTEMETKLSHIDFTRVRHHEEKTRHEVMAHLKAFGDVCPKAKGILHLGATSAFVMDNTDLIQMRDGLIALKCKFLAVITLLANFADEHRSLPCLSYTHLQPAQPTTMGKRAALWLQDLLWDFYALDNFLQDLPFLGTKGATGTQASFLKLFSGNSNKALELDQKIAIDFGFTQSLSLSSQTYPRKIDFNLLCVLSSLATTIHKFANDIRLLSHMGEVHEPFEENQVGSSAMPYKRNPIRCERLCSLSRYLISLWQNGAYTASLQWLERSLDDSAGRRIYLPEAFLTADALLNLFGNVLSGLTIHPSIIKSRLDNELPLLATENILMKASEKGLDRNEVHEKLQKLTREKNLLQQIEKEIGLSKKELDEILNIQHFIGRAPEQVEDFLKKEVHPVLKKYPSYLSSLTPIEI